MKLTMSQFGTIAIVVAMTFFLGGFVTFIVAAEPPFSLFGVLCACYSTIGGVFWLLLAVVTRLFLLVEQS